MLLIFLELPKLCSILKTAFQDDFFLLVRGLARTGLIFTGLQEGAQPGGGGWPHLAKQSPVFQILLKAGFAIKRSKVKGPAQEIQFLGIKWQDGRRQIPMDVINKIAAMSPPTSKKEAQAFLGVVGFWRMHIPNYSQIVSPLYHVTRKKNDFEWGPEQWQAFEQIKGR